MGGKVVIVNKTFYKCKNCKERYFYETNKPHSTKCPKCGNEMEMKWQEDCDTDLADQIKQQAIHDRSTMNFGNNGKPIVQCPYCKSANTTKITATSKAVNTALFGFLGIKRHKQWHCNQCKSDF